MRPRTVATLVAVLIVVASGIAASCARRVSELTVAVGRMGTARLFLPHEPDGALVLVFSDTRGFDAELASAAQRLAASGVLVVGIDLPTYLRQLAAREEGCHDVVSDVEELSHRVQRDQGLQRYRLPILAGVGAGATLAYAALAQSPAATVAGAVSIDPAHALATRVPLCAGAVATPFSGGGFTYAVRNDLPGWWRLSAPPGAAPAAAGPALVETAARGGSAGDRLVALVSTAVGADDAASTAAGLSVVEYPSESGSDVLTVIYSGDGGWRDLDKQIGEYLSARGLPVVGVDCLRSFWSAKTPDEMAADLGQLITTYAERWGTKRVVLVGYSFGAGVLPFAIERLSTEDRARIVLVALLGVEPRADFEIRFTGWLGQEPDATAPEVLPALLKLDLARLQCFYGEEEQDSLCRLPALARAEVVRTAGGHHFDGDYDALARRILDGIERRAPGAVPARTQPTETPSRRS